MPPTDRNLQGLAGEAPVLWHLAISHYSEKARWALDFKGIEYVRRAVTPGLQELTARRLRAGRTVPILELQGRAIGDSTKIIEEIERRWPDPPLYPAEPNQRSRALELEDHFDEQCGPDARRVLFNDNLTDSDTFVAMFVGADRRRIRPLEALTPLICELVKWRFQVRPEAVGRSRETVRSAFDKVAADAGPSGYLVGDSFTVADLTAASILSLVVVPPEFPYIKVHPDERTAQSRRFRDSLRDHPGFKWVEDMYSRHRGTSAAVAASTRSVSVASVR